MKAPDWWKRFIAQPEPPTNGKPIVMAPVLMGIRRNGKWLELCMPGTFGKGVKLVTISEDFLERYNELTASYNLMQLELKAMPTSLRPRKSRKGPTVESTE